MSVAKQIISKHQVEQAVNEWDVFKNDFKVRKTALSLSLELDNVGTVDEREGRVEHIDIILDYAAAFERYLRLGRAPH